MGNRSHHGGKAGHEERHQGDRPRDAAPATGHWEDFSRMGIRSVTFLLCLRAFFMLREVEASLLLAANARTDNVNQVVTIRLPCTKTDPAAASVERSWGCLCSVRGVVGCLCLSAELQLNFLGLLFGDLRLRDDLPFFPSSRGTTVEKSKVVGTFEHVHAALGLPVRDEDGHRLLGGHSMRLAGARLLAASGITCIKLSWWLGGDHRC